MSARADYLAAIEAAIRIQHRCRPTHRETVFVHEKTRENETVWEGFIEVFDVKGHRRAKTCYAWEDIDGDGDRKIFTLLETKVIDSPSRAVQAAIFMDKQRVRKGAEQGSTTAEKLVQLRSTIEKGMENIRRTAIKMENLNAAIEASEQSQHIQPKRLPD